MLPPSQATVKFPGCCRIFFGQEIPPRVSNPGVTHIRSFFFKQVYFIGMLGLTTDTWKKIANPRKISPCPPKEGTISKGTFPFEATNGFLPGTWGNDTSGLGQIEAATEGELKSCDWCGLFEGIFSFLWKEDNLSYIVLYFDSFKLEQSPDHQPCWSSSVLVFGSQESFPYRFRCVSVHVWMHIVGSISCTAWNLGCIKPYRPWDTLPT